MTDDQNDEDGHNLDHRSTRHPENSTTARVYGYFPFLTGEKFTVPAEHAVGQRWMWASAKLLGIPGSFASCSRARIPGWRGFEII